MVFSRNHIWYRANLRVPLLWEIFFLVKNRKGSNTSSHRHKYSNRLKEFCPSMQTYSCSLPLYANLYSLCFSNHTRIRSWKYKFSSKVYCQPNEMPTRYTISGTLLHSLNLLAREINFQHIWNDTVKITHLQRTTDRISYTALLNISGAEGTSCKIYIYI